jgi:hypothetical protein
LTLEKILVLFWNCHEESFISMVQNSNLRHILNVTKVHIF